MGSGSIWTLLPKASSTSPAECSSKVDVDKAARVWIAELAIPMAALYR